MKKLLKSILLFTFRKTIAGIIHDSTAAINLRTVIDMNKSATSVYVEALEFIRVDIDKYLTPHSGLSARRAMRDMYDFCGHKLETLNKIVNEYTKLENKDENRSKK